MRTPLLLLATLTLLSAGCRPSASRRPLLDRDPIFVIPAVEGVANGDRRATRTNVNQLINLLDSDDAAVRLTASEALQELSGEDFGFRSWLGPKDRQPIIARWRQWLAEVEGS